MTVFERIRNAGVVFWWYLLYYHQFGMMPVLLVPAVLAGAAVLALLAGSGVLGRAASKLASGDIAQLTTHHIQIRNFQKREATLEDVFVDLVGKSMEEVEHGHE